jgi:hypothetical protein
MITTIKKQQKEIQAVDGVQRAIKPPGNMMTHWLLLGWVFSAGVRVEEVDGKGRSLFLRERIIFD